MHGVAPRGRSVVWWGGLSVVVIAVFVIASYLIHPDPIQVHAEGGPIEWAQLVGWFVALGVALAIVVHQRGRDRFNGVWLATIAGLAAARELDLHEALNSEALGVWAVHFKSRWVLDASVPIWVKAFWAAVALVGAGLLLVPPVVVRAPVFALLRARDAGLILFGVSVGLIGVGYAADDIFGRGLITSEEPMQALEEVAELLGVAAFVGSAIVTLRYPLSRRIAAARGSAQAGEH